MVTTLSEKCPDQRNDRWFKPKAWRPLADPPSHLGDSEQQNVELDVIGQILPRFRLAWSQDRWLVANQLDRHANP